MSATTRPRSDPPTPAATAPRGRLRFIAAGVGVLLVVLVLADAILYALGSPTTLMTWASPMITPARQVLLLVLVGANLLLGGLVVLLAGACLGRYRPLTGVFAALMAGGALVRMSWPFWYFFLATSGTLREMRLFGGELLSSPQTMFFLLTALPWIMLGTSVVLMLIGALGLVIVSPRRPREEPRGQ